MGLPKTIAAASKSKSRGTRRPKAPKVSRGGGTRRGY